MYPIKGWIGVYLLMVIHNIVNTGLEQTYTTCGRIGHLMLNNRSLIHCAAVQISEVPLQSLV